MRVCDAGRVLTPAPASFPVDERRLPGPLRRAAAASAAALLVAMSAGACSHPAPSPGVLDASEVVARGTGFTITAAAVAAEMRARSVPAGAALDDLIRFQVLARAASAASTMTDEADREQVRALEVQRLLARDIEPQLAPSALPDSDVRALYDRGQRRFVHGRLVEVTVLCIFTGARMKPEPRAHAAETARALKAYVDALPAKTKTAADFEAVARDPVWVDRKISVSTVWQDSDDPFPAAVGRAVQALSKPGDTTDLISDETGYYIARYRSERASEHVTFEQAAPALRAEMYQPWSRQRFLQITLDMARGHDIEVFPENFPKLAGDDIAAR